jgi:hypothetical protein
MLTSGHLAQLCSSSNVAVAIAVLRLNEMLQLCRGSTFRLCDAASANNSSLHLLVFDDHLAPADVIGGDWRLLQLKLINSDCNSHSAMSIEVYSYRL